jgi:hypothetical protein
MRPLLNPPLTGEEEIGGDIPYVPPPFRGRLGGGLGIIREDLKDPSSILP